MTHIKQTDQEITVEGHAGYDKPGKDIVCAGISAITTTLIMTLEEIGTDMPTPCSEKMIMNSRDYWAEREAEALKDYITEEKEYSKRINEIYEETLQGI